MTDTALIDQAIAELKLTTISGQKYFAKPVPGHWQNAMGYLAQAKSPTPQIVSPHEPPVVGDRLAVT